MKKRAQQWRSKARPVKIRAQHGAALVVALVILLVVSILSVTGASQTLLGEKMASNQYSQTKAFLAAETGISEAIKAANTLKVAQAVFGGSPKFIALAWANGWHKQGFSKVSGNHLLGGGAAFNIAPVNGNNAYWNAKHNAFEIVSTGTVSTGSKQLSKRTLVAYIAAPTLNANKPFGGALGGQLSVALRGHTLLDTYNSMYGKYNTSVSVNGKSFTNASSAPGQSIGQLNSTAVTTCSTGQIITGYGGQITLYGNLVGLSGATLHGDPQIHGYIRINGDANLDSGHVFGDVTAGGKVTVASTVTVGGNILSGTALADNGTLDGNAYVYGNASLGSNSSFSANSTVKATGTVTPSSIAPPIISEHVAKSNLPKITPVTSNLSACATFTNSSSDLTQLFDLYSNASRLPASGSQGLTIGTSGKQTAFHVLGDFPPSGVSQVYINGDVTIRVDGNFDPKRTVLNVPRHASLKLLVKGTSSLTSANVSVNGPFVRFDSSGQRTPALAIYSMYSSSTGGVTLGKKSTSYKLPVAVYAPNAKVNIHGGGGIYGAVVAQNIKQAGQGAIHYDQALSRVAIDKKNESINKSAKLLSWQQQG